MGLKYLTQQQLNIIRGKSLVGAATPKEILSVFAHYDKLEMWLEELSCDDTFGTEGWQHAAGLPE